MIDQIQEMLMKILEYAVDQMQGPLRNVMSDMWRFYCHGYFDGI